MINEGISLNERWYIEPLQICNLSEHMVEKKQMTMIMMMIMMIMIVMMIDDKTKEMGDVTRQTKLTNKQNSDLEVPKDESQHRRSRRATIQRKPSIHRNVSREANHHRGRISHQQHQRRLRDLRDGDDRLSPRLRTQLSHVPSADRHQHRNGLRSSDWLQCSFEVCFPLTHDIDISLFVRLRSTLSLTRHITPWISSQRNILCSGFGWYQEGRRLSSRRRDPSDVPQSIAYLLATNLCDVMWLMGWLLSVGSTRRQRIRVRANRSSASSDRTWPKARHW